jgi:hypothetical protein
MNRAAAEAPTPDTDCRLHGNSRLVPLYAEWGSQEKESIGCSLTIAPRISRLPHYTYRLVRFPTAGIPELGISKILSQTRKTLQPSPYKSIYSLVERRSFLFENFQRLTPQSSTRFSFKKT